MMGEDDDFRLVVTDSDPSEALESPAEPFGQIAASIEIAIVGPGSFAVGEQRHYWLVTQTESVKA